MEKEWAICKGFVLRPRAWLEPLSALRHGAADVTRNATHNSSRHRSGPPRDRGYCATYANAAGAKALRAYRGRGLCQIRKPSSHQLVQGSRRLCEAVIVE